MNDPLGLFRRLAGIAAVFVAFSLAIPKGAWAQSDVDPAAVATRAVEQREVLIELLLGSQARAEERYTELLEKLSASRDGILASQDTTGDPATNLDYGKLTGSTREWRFSDTGKGLFDLALMLAAPDSPHQGDEEIVIAMTLALDFLQRNQHDDGHWYQSDTNVDRFTLAPLIDALILTSEELVDHEHWPQWVEMLEKAGDFQMAHYGGGEHVLAGRYPNMDGFFAMCMTLLGILFEDGTWREAGLEMAASAAEHCLCEDGAYEYIAGWNPVPVYQDLTVVTLGRAYLATSDPTFSDQLSPLTQYYSYYPEISGCTDGGMQPFFKHYWEYGNLAGYSGQGGDGLLGSAPEFIAYLTDSPQAAAVANTRHVEYISDPTHGGRYFPSLGLLWLSDAVAGSLPADFLIRSPGVSGFEQRRQGNWTTWLTGKEIALDTLVSALASTADADPELDAAVAGVVVEIDLRVRMPGASGAKARINLLDAEQNLFQSYWADVLPAGQWEEVELSFDAPYEVSFIRLDLFQFFHPGTVYWDDIELFSDGPVATNLIVNGDFENPGSAGADPVGWYGSGWGTSGSVEYVQEGYLGGWCVKAVAPPDTTEPYPHRAGWSPDDLIAIEGGTSYVFRAQARTGEAMDPLLYPFYIGDMNPRVTQRMTGNAAAQVYSSRLHAIGQTERYPTPRLNRSDWQWEATNGGSPTSAPFDCTEVWMLADGLLVGRIVAVASEDAQGSGFHIRIPTYPEGVELTGSEHEEVYDYRTDPGEVEIAAFRLQGGLLPTVVEGYHEGSSARYFYGDELVLTDSPLGESVDWSAGQQLAASIAMDRILERPSDLLTRIQDGFLASFEARAGLEGLALCQPATQRIQAVLANLGDELQTLGLDEALEIVAEHMVCQGDSSLMLLELAPPSPSRRFDLEPGGIALLEATWEVTLDEEVEQSGDEPTPDSGIDAQGEDVVSDRDLSDAGEVSDIEPGDLSDAEAVPDAEPGDLSDAEAVPDAEPGDLSDAEAVPDAEPGDLSDAGEVLDIEPADSLGVPDEGCGCSGLPGATGPIGLMISLCLGFVLWSRRTVRHH